MVHSWKNHLVYKIAVVIATIFWVFSFIEIVNHSSKNPQILGRYSFPYFLYLILFGGGIFFWLALLLVPRIVEFSNKLITRIQAKSWLAVACLLFLALLAWLLLEYETKQLPLGYSFEVYPALHATLLIFIILSAGLILFANWGPATRSQHWRLVFAVPLAGLILFELILQLLAFGSILPSGFQTVAGVSVPYGRVYDSRQGLGNGVSNRFGWYYPEFQLDSASRKFVLIGDDLILASDTQRDKNIGTALEKAVDTTQPDSNVEVLALGAAGFGPAHYLDMVTFSLEVFEPDEVIVFINMADDFQNVLHRVDPRPPSEYFFYDIDENGVWNLHVRSVLPRHLLRHFLFNSQTSLAAHTLPIFRSHYLTPKVLEKVINNLEQDQIIKADALSEDQNIFGPGSFIFDKNGGKDAEDALLLTTDLLKLAGQYAASQDVTLRIVTIPAFPEGFYSRYPQGDWSPDLGEHDLFLPEDKIRKFAQEHNISVLTMGQYLLVNNMDVDDLKALYFLDGQGHLTPEGYDTFAKALNSCFYNNSQQSLAQSDKVYCVN